ncbi:MAG: hypothetical protein ABI876_11670, partial [Bacteroidota bacterium]
MNIEDLISQYIDGNLSSEAEAELHHRLAVSPEARKLFRSQIALRSVARDQRVLQTPAPELRSALFGRLQREEGMKPLEGIPASPPVVAAVARSIPSPAVRDGRRRRRAAIWLIPFITALLAVVIVWNGEEDKPAGMQSPVFSDARPQAAPERKVATSDAVSPSAPTTGKVESPDASGSAKEPVRADGGAGASASVPKEESHLMASNDVVERKSARGYAMAEGPRSEDDRNGIGADNISNQLAPETEHAAEADKLDRDAKADDAHYSSESPKLMNRQIGSYQSGASSVQRDIAYHTTPTQTMGKSKDIAQAEGPTMQSVDPLPPPPSSPMLGGGSGMGSSPRFEQMQQLSNSVAKANVPASALLSPSAEIAMADTTAPVLQNRSSDQQDDAGMAKNIPSSSPVAQALSPISAAVNSGQYDNNSGLVVSSTAPVSSTDESFPAEPVSPPVTFILSLTPASYISLRSGQINLDGAFRAGVELGGRHQVYAVAGLSGYRNTIADSLVGTTINGVTTSAARKADITSGTASEIYGGAGYRYNIPLNQKVGVSPGVWGGVSGRHLSAGVEAPITFRPSRWVRLELT